MKPGIKSDFTWSERLSAMNLTVVLLNLFFSFPSALSEPFTGNVTSSVQEEISTFAGAAVPRDNPGLYNVTQNNGLEIHGNASGVRVLQPPPLVKVDVKYEDDTSWGRNSSDVEYISITDLPYVEEESSLKFSPLESVVRNGGLVNMETNTSSEDDHRMPLEISPARRVLESLLTMSEEEETLSSDLEWLLDAYNPHSWRSGPPGELAEECRGQMGQFLEALHNETTWAARMADASGRYSSQFFFGNDFWLGSHSLCHELKGATPLQPPFEITFHVARMNVVLSRHLTPGPRTVFLGLCLPTSCSPQDITSLLHSSSARGNLTRSLKVVSVRPVPGDYSLLQDLKVYILGGTTAVVLLLMAVATCYELILENRDTLSKKAARASSDSEGSGNNNQATVKGGLSAGPTSARKVTANRPGLLSQMLLAFSAMSNGRKILYCGSSEESITSVHGLRFMSLAWVIMVHTYLQAFAIAENKTLRTVTERNFMYQTISNATFSVDTFFFISGLLVTILYLRSISRGEISLGNKGPGFKSSFIKFFTLLIYRFIRLTPAYLFVLGLVEISMRWTHNTSVFEPNVLDHINCENYWWRNALYLNNLFPRSEMCMLWSWYMANDTQFYVLGIFLLMLSVRFSWLVAAMWSVILVSSWCVTAYISFLYSYQARIQEPFALFDELYDKPWTRVGPYLIGMATGWYLFKTNCRVKIPYMVVALGWMASLSCLVSLVYGLLHFQLDIATSAAYVGLGHTAWGLALSWIVVACCSGYGGMVDRLLSFKALYPLSRLTYCAYLVHPMIMVLTSFQMDGPLHLHNGLVVILYLGNVVAAFLLSFLISLGFEAPVVRLLKISMTYGKKNS